MAVCERPPGLVDVSMDAKRGQEYTRQNSRSEGGKEMVLRRFAVASCPCPNSVVGELGDTAEKVLQ
jgi:hypothetical protein